VRTDFDRIYLTAHGKIAIVTMNHPEVMNAASPKMVHGLSTALKHIEQQGDMFRAVVLTGEGRGFCSGANLSEIQDRPEGQRDAGKVLEDAFHPLLRQIRYLKMPFLTAVNGAAAGIGMSFALMGDIVLAARSAYFLQAFARIGLVPDGGSTWLLPRLIGLARARELSLLAEKLPAETAHHWGLINRVCDDEALLGDTLKLAERLADGPTAAYAAIRELYWASPHNSFEEQINLERQTQKKIGQTQDFIEGVSAFLQKRQAKFAGK